MLGVEVNGPVILGACLEASEYSVSIVMFSDTVRNKWSRCVGVEGEATDCLFDASPSIPVTEMD